MAVFNSGVRGKRARDGAGVIGTHNQFVQKESPVPAITAYTVTGIDDTALDPAGGQTVIVTGYGFAAGMTGLIGGTSISILTVVSSTQVTFTSPAKSAGSYALTLANTNGSAAILVPGLTYSSVPTWTTSAGPLASIYETTAINSTLVATSDSSITYTQVSGDLPPGATLASDGTITGTAPVSSGATTYEFTVKATDAEMQDVSRTFTITVNTDVVTWSTPASGQSYTLVGGVPMADVTLGATSAAGYSVSYTANALPTGVTLSSNTISGTPTAAEEITTLLTATAATTNRTATRTISWSVSLGDLSWKNVTLLLNGSTPTTTFINDASLNNSQLTIAGDTKPTPFTPYSEGYYSAQFNGTSDYITLPASSNWDFGTGDFTIECWVNHSAITSTDQVIAFHGWSGSGGFNYGWNLRSIATTGVLGFSVPTSGIDQRQFSDLVFKAYRWHHVAICCVSGVVSAYLDGVKSATTYSGAIFVARPTMTLVLGGWNNNTESIAERQWFGGYISNFRIVKGTALYTATFTPPTSPLTSIANTRALICQSNRFVDNSFSSAPVTVVTSKTSLMSPFTLPTSSTYNTLYSTTFDGTGDYLTTAANTALDMGTGDFTIECFTVTRGYEGGTYGRGVFALFPSGNYNKRIIVRHSSAGNILAIYGYDGSSTYFGSSGTGGTFNLIPGQWHHIAFVRQSGVFRLYIDGVQDIVITNQTAVTLATSNCVEIGRVQEGGADQWNGVISNFRVIKGTCLYPNGTTFTRPSATLTAVSGTSLLTCQDSTVKDNSANAIAITVSNQAQPVAVSPFTMTTSSTTLTSLGSAYFSASSAFTTYSPAGSDIFGTGDFTVECWLNPTSTTAVNISMASSATNTWELLTYSNQLYWHENGGNLGGSGYGSIALNTWSHLAVSRSGTTLRMFINGVQVYSVTNSYNYSASPTTRSVGPYSGGSAPYYLSDFRVIKGTALYPGNFLPPQTPLTPVTNTSLLTCQYNGGANNNGMVDQSGFNNILTRNGNTTSGMFSPFSQTGWSTFFVSGYSSLRAPANSAFNFDTGDFTVELWYYAVSVAVDARLLSNAAYNGSGIDISYQSGSNRIAWYINSTAYHTATLPSSNQWHHLAFSRVGSNFYVFVDGELKNTYTSFSATITSANDLYIGNYYNQAVPFEGGYLSNLRIVKGTGLYSVPFTPSTVPLTSIQGTSLLVCQSNRFIDNSSNNFTITPLGVTTVQAFSPFGGVTNVPASYSMYFDGTGDSLSVPANANLVLGSSDFTIEGWMYFNETTNDQSLVYWNAKTDGYAAIYVKIVTGKWALWVSTSGSGWAVQQSALGSTVTANTWYHVAVVRSGTNVKLYINGSDATSGGYTVSGSLMTTYTLNQIGTYNTSYNYMNGYISNFRIVNGTAVYTSNFTPSTTPLTAIVNTSLLTCKSATIIDSSTNNFTITAVADAKPTTFNPFGNTTTTNVAYNPAIHGSSIYMDGSGDYLTAPNSKSFDLSAGAWTIECWFYQFAAKTVTLFSVGPTRWRVCAFDNGGGHFFFNGSSEMYIAAGTFPLGQWHHIAVSCIGDGSAANVKTFANGKLIGTGQFVPALDTTNIFYVGRNSDAGAGWDMNGYISDVSITKGVNKYLASFVPPVAPITRTQHTAFLLNGNSSGIVDTHSTSNLETVGNTQLGSEDPYGGRYYSVNLNSLGYLTTPANSVFDLVGSGGSFTIEAWVYFNSYNTMAGSGSYIAGTYQSSSGWLWGFNGIGNVTQLQYIAYTSGSGTQANITVDTTLIPLGKWIHVATVNNSGTLTTYINGVATGGTTSAPSYTGSGGQLAIGVYQQNLGYAGNPDWLISNLRITKGQALYTSAFTPSTIPLTTTSQSASAANVSILTCQSSSFKDNSTNNFTLTRNTAGLIKSKNPFQQNTGKSLYFDGNGDYMNVPTGSPTLAFSTGDFTIEFWAYTTTAAAQTFFDNRNPDTANAGFDITLLATSNYLRFSTSGTAYIDGTHAFVVGRWNHIALTRASNSFKLYLNGTQTGSTYTGSTTQNYTNTNTRIGSGAVGPMTGYIKDLRITKGVARTITVPTNPLEAK